MVKNETRASQAAFALTRSTAFRQATLRGEVRRAYAVIGVLALVSVVVFGRKAPPELDYHVYLAIGIGLVILFAIQLLALAVARWARARERSIPNWFTVATVVVE